MDPAEIAGEIYLPSVRGTLNVDLVDYAERFGFWVRSYRGSVEDLKRKIDAGVPVIVLARLPGLFRRPNHYFMVIGYEDRRRVFLVHSGTRADQVLPQPMLDGWWAANRRWALLVCPPDRIAWELTAGEANDLGVWLERAGRFEEALGRYAESLRTDPDQAYVHVNRGNALAALGQVVEAEGAYRQALLLDPDNVAGLNNLACAVAERDGDLEEALDLARRAVEIDLLERPNSLDTLALVLMRAGHLEEARRCVEQGLVIARERGRDDWVAMLEGRLDEIRAAETRGRGECAVKLSLERTDETAAHRGGRRPRSRLPLRAPLGAAVLPAGLRSGRCSGHARVAGFPRAGRDRRPSPSQGGMGGPWRRERRRQLG